MAVTPPDLIKSWGDLPAEYRRMYTQAALRYRSSRMYASDRDADRAAFEDVRAQYWSSLKTVRKKTDAAPRLL